MAAILRTLAAIIVAIATAPAAASNGSEVRVTAVVTNASGEPLPGLRAGDFELTVDGAPQPIQNIEFRKGGIAPRAFALVLDEFHVDAGSSEGVRTALTTLIDGHLRAGDLGFVFKPLDSLTAIEPTADTDALRHAIASFQGRKNDFAPRNDFERRYMAQAPAAVAAARAQIVSSALRAAAARLGEMRGVRPAIVLVTDGFARQRVDRSVPANLLSAVLVANRGDVPVYVFSPAGPDPAAADAENPARTALLAVAARTGGDVIDGAASFPAGLARMSRDLDAHYVLSYQPSHGDDGRFHSLQVTLKRGNARVRTRAGYVAPLAAALRATTGASAAPMRILRRSSFIQSWSGVTKGPDGRPRVMFTWEPAAPRPGAVRPAPAQLVVTASTPDGSVLFDGHIVAAAAEAAGDAAKIALFDAPPGRVLIDVKVLDAKGVVLDTDARDLEVPDLEKARDTILPPAILRSTSAREFQAVSQDPDAAPAPSREFRRTERLLLRTAAFDGTGASARVSAMLLNRWRQPMRPLPAMSESVREGVTQFDVPLAALAPGEYSIRLTAGTATEYVTFRVRG